MNTNPTRLAALVRPAQTFVDAHPPRLRAANKQLVHQLACPPGSRHEGEIALARWCGYLPVELPAAPRPRLENRPGAFAYAAPTDGTVAWHVNFADGELFCYYGSALLAQDELQVAEHPALASVREALLVECEATPALRPRTREEDDTPTPYLFQNVERRVALTVDRLYGNAFDRAPADEVRAAARRLDPPTRSNILAMEAPSSGAGRYTAVTIRDALRTAWIGFSAARLTSTPVATVVHTGHWGCGAYGGNHTLMALLQLAAAHLARLDTLVFHTFSAALADRYHKARALLDELVPEGRPTNVSAFIARVEALGFHWGHSDGN